MKDTFKSLRRSEWISGSLKPKIAGVYERLYSKAPAFRFSRWTGKRWMAPRQTVEEADQTTIPSIYPDLPWRGLAEKPK